MMRKEYAEASTYNINDTLTSSFREVHISCQSVSSPCILSIGLDHVSVLHAVPQARPFRTAHKEKKIYYWCLLHLALHAFHLSLITLVVQ
jgi:hypothetical protein